MRGTKPTRVHRRLTTIVLLSWLSGVAGAQAQPDAPRAPYSGAADITAVDTMIAVDPSALRTWLHGKEQPRLAPADLAIEVGGRDRQVVAIEMPDERTEPWDVVLYFDRSLSHTGTLRWAATVLGDRIERLTALGPVTVVTTEPEPSISVDRSRDPEELGAVLGRMALGDTGEDALMALRYETLDARDELLSGEVDGDEAVTVLANEERRLVAQSQDQLLGWLLDRDTHSPRKVLVLVSDGHDQAPEHVYRRLLGLDDTGIDTEIDDEPGATDASPSARLLAAYGWTTVVLRAPPPPPPAPGLRIGKWRFSKPGITTEDTGRGGPYEDAQRDRVPRFLLAIGAVHEENRDPEKAAAYDELGRARQAQGDLEGAARAYEKAIYHYDDDPDTATEVAGVWHRLGTVYAAQGDVPQATLAFERAVFLDPSRAASEGDGPVVAPRTGDRAIARLAEATSGGLVRSVSGLEAALADLDRRIRVTFQIAGAPSDQLMPVIVTSTRSRDVVRAAGWARNATPNAVRALRLRRLLDSGIDAGPLALGVTPRPGNEDDIAIDVTWATPGNLPELGGLDAWLRVSTLMIEVADPPRLPPLAPAEATPLAEAALASWRYTAQWRAPAKRSLLLVLVEELRTGQWGGVVRTIPRRR